MKKLLLLGILATISFSANAQFFSGLSFDIKWQNNGTKAIQGEVLNTTDSYNGAISPQFGYKFNPKFMVGARLNFLFDKSYYSLTNKSTKKDENYISSSIGWDIAPFCRYKLAEFGKNGWFSIWADLHAYFGSAYPKYIKEEGYIFYDFNKKFVYGIQAMPALGFKINENTTIFANIAILSLAYSGTCTHYKDGIDYDNNIILFTGKISGLFSAIANEGTYGIKLGIVRTFGGKEK